MREAPARGATLDTRRTDRVARGLEAIVSRALEGNLASRYATADELLTDLLHLSELRDAGHRATYVTRTASSRGGRWAHLPLRIAPVAIIATALAAGGAASALLVTRTASSSLVHERIEPDSTRTPVVSRDDVTATASEVRRCPQSPLLTDVR